VAIDTCNKHPTVKWDIRCQQCQKPACRQCIVNKSFCSEACSARYNQFMSNYKKPAQLGRSPIPGILLFLAVVAGLYFLAKKQGWLPW
jgi:hypothetical protein